MTIATLERIKQKIERLPLDIRVEVILGELLKNKQLEEKKMLIQPLGVFRRNYRRDLDALDIQKDEFGALERIHISIWREGLFDTLPSGLFFNTRSKKKRDPEKNTANKYAEEERAARTFFLPFEQVYYDQRIALERLEQEFIYAFTSEKGKEIFADFWKLDHQNIAEEYLVTLLYLLPLIYQYKGQLKHLEKLYPAILGDPIHFEKKWDNEQKVPDDLIPKLGMDTFLGQSSVLGNTFCDGLPSLKIVVGPIAQKELIHYLPGRKKDLLLQFLNRMLLAAEITLDSIEIQIKLKSKDQDFILEKDTKHKGRLGYTTILS